MNDDVYYVVVDFYDEKFVPSFKQLNKTNKGEKGRKNNSHHIQNHCTNKEINQ